MGDITFARNSKYFIPEHCGKCVHADDHGIVGNAMTCAVDQVDRWPWEDCAHVESFVEVTKPLEERYPGYDPKFFKSNDRFLGKLMMIGVEEGKHKLVEIQGLGQFIVDGRVKIDRAAFTGTYETEPAPKDAA